MRDNLAIGILAVFKESENLIGWEILPDGVYEPVDFVDPVTGQVLSLVSIIEQPTTRKGNCPGAGSLAPPGACYGSEYEGVVLSLTGRSRAGPYPGSVEPCSPP